MMNVSHIKNHGWALVTSDLLTDEAAQALTFRAAPEQVVLGEFVEISDAGGLRIGHVQYASYIERYDGPAYVVVGINLR